jgi:hypothetical protein
MRPVFLAKPLRLLTSSALGLGLLLSTGCSKTTTDEQGLLMSNDFDHLSGWLDNAPSLTHDVTLGQLSSTRPHKIRISAWVMRTDDPHAAKLIVEIKDPATGTQVFGDSIDLGKAVQKLNTWQHVEHVITVPPLVSATSHIMVYMSGTGASQPTYLDDLALRLVTK